MGKWTQLHVENVLVEKLRLMVQSAMQDIKDNDADSPMSFDAFAEHLDTNNAFVKHLLELMLIETADTQTNIRDPESTHISSRAFSKLQALSDRYHVNDRRSRRLSTRRAEVIPPLSSNGPPRMPDLTADGWTDVADELELEDEAFGMALGDFPLATGSMAGRYDVMVPDGIDPETGLSRLRHAITPPWDDVGPASARTNAVPSTSPPLDTRPWTYRLRADTTNTSTLSSTGSGRQQTARRPVRQRMVDFNDWTGRARANARRGQDTTPRAVSGDSLEEDDPSAPVLPTLVPHRPISLPNYYRDGPSLPDYHRDGPSDSEDPEPYAYTSRVHRPLRQSSGSHDFLSSASAMRRNFAAGRLRRGGIPPPENMLTSSLGQNNNHLTVGSGVTALPMLPGAPAVFNRSPSPLINLFEGIDGGISRSPVPPRTERTHLATPRSSTPGSVEAVEGESTNASGPTGAAEMA